MKPQKKGRAWHRTPTNPRRARECFRVGGWHRFVGRVQVQPQYGGSTLAQEKICSYSAAALFQLESRSIPRSWSARKLSGCCRNVSSAYARAEMNASVEHGENVQPVPTPAVAGH